MRIIMPKRGRRSRPDLGRRRASRSFASSFAALENRALLSAGAVEVSAIAAAGPSMAQGPRDDGSSSPSTLDPDLTPTTEDPGRGWATPPPAPNNRGMGGPPRNWSEDRVAMAEVSIPYQGRVAPEFAFADEARGTVNVIVGRNSMFSCQGLARPGAVALADLDGNGPPDLIVADSGDNRILVFPGLPGGGFNSNPGAARSFNVGDDPTGITVGDVNGDGTPDLIVANAGSGSVSILLGHGSLAGWTMTSGTTLQAGSRPVRTALVQADGDNVPDLFVLDGGSNDVMIYRGVGDGEFDVNPRSFAVGRDPVEMLIGLFDHRSGLDLVTVNSGSDNLTFIGGVLGPAPTTMNYTSGGTEPVAAFAVDANHDGTLDLVVANAGDGRVALLQPAESGLRLAGVISRPDLPAPTAILPDRASPSGIELYAATAGADAAAILQFDLGAASTFLAAPDRAVSDGDGELIAQLLPFGESTLDLVAVLYNGGPESEAWSDGGSSRGRSANSILVAQGPGAVAPEGGGQDGPNGEGPSTPEPADPVAVVDRLFFGVEAELGRPRRAVEAVAARDAAEIAPIRPVRIPSDSDAIDAALDSLWEPDGARSVPVGFIPPRGPAPVPVVAPTLPAEPEPSGAEVRSEAWPVISSALLAARLIFKASKPRPPRPADSQGD